MQILLALILSSGLQAAPTLTAQVIVQECWKGNSHPQMSLCVNNRAAAATSELARIEQLITQAIEKRKLNDLSIQFKASTNSYREYRMRQCQYQENLAAAGNGAADIRIACEAAMDSQRAAELKASRSWLGL